MRLIDADELRRQLERYPWPMTDALACVNSAPTVDVPQPLTRDGVLAEVARIEAAGDTAVVEMLAGYDGRWYRSNLNDWVNPDVPRWNVRVRAVPVETETVPLTQLVGRTIKGETEAVEWIRWACGEWRWGTVRVFAPTINNTKLLPVDLATGMVTVLKGEA